MSRVPISTLIGLLTTDLPNNNTKEITPDKVRLVLASILESCATVTSLIGGSPLVPVTMNLTTTPTKMSTGVYSVVLNGNPLVMEARLAQEDVVLQTPVGRAFLSFNCTFTAANGVDVAFTLARNGAPLVFRSVQTGRGAANQISVEFSWIFETIVPGDYVELFIASLAGVPAINIYNAAIKCIMLPQFAP